MLYTKKMLQNDEHIYYLIWVAESCRAQVIQFLIVGCWALALGVGIMTSAISDENYRHSSQVVIPGQLVDKL